VLCCWVWFAKLKFHLGARFAGMVWERRLTWEDGGCGGARCGAAGCGGVGCGHTNSTLLCGDVGWGGTRDRIKARIP
jgi:hypothetical protein